MTIDLQSWSEQSQATTSHAHGLPAKPPPQSGHVKAATRRLHAQHHPAPALAQADHLPDQHPHSAHTQPPSHHVHPASPAPVQPNRNARTGTPGENSAEPLVAHSLLEEPDQ